MGLGYEVYEDNRDFVQEGLTGEVKRHVSEDMRFPSIIVQMDDEHPVEDYKVQVLRSMLKTATSYDEAFKDTAISVYFYNGEKSARFGQITSHQVRALLQLFASNNLVGYLNKDTILEGHYLFALSD